MKNIFWPSSSNPVHSSGFSHLFYYFEKFNVNPKIHSSRAIVKDSTIEKIRDLSSNNVLFQETSTSFEKDKFGKKRKKEKTREIVFEHKDALICFSKNSYFRAGKNNDMYIFYQHLETLEEIKKLVDYQIDDEKSHVNLLCASDEGLYLKKFKVNLPCKDLDLELNYGKELVEKNNKLIKHFNSQTSGLVLFSGQPGTGKSTYVKYLSTQLNKKIIYLPSSSIELIASPEFLSFMTNQSNSIVLLEDAEKVLMSREHNLNQGVSNILNITDGLLGDCLKISIIATFNTSRDLIDPALLRKGRLFLEHEFDKLSVEQTNSIFKKLSLEKTTDVPMSLAEIYNLEENYCKLKEVKKIGF